mgnify:CR=1 FL=1
MTVRVFNKYCVMCEKETKHIHDDDTAGGDLCAMIWCDVCCEAEYLH